MRWIRSLLLLFEALFLSFSYAPAEATPPASPLPVIQVEEQVLPSPPAQGLPPATGLEVPAPTPEVTPDPASAPSFGPAPHPKYSRGGDKLPILMFHSVVPDGGETGDWTVSAGELRSYLQWLADHGYTTVLPSQIAAGEALPDRAVLLTFDDGYADNYTVAYPILREFQARAVISLVVHYQDEGNPGMLSWDMCREMAASGLVEFGSHTYEQHGEDHNLRRLDGETRQQYEERIFPDIDRSVERIQAELKAPVTFFAYPNGQTDRWSHDFLAQRFTMTVTTTYGTARLSRGLLRLPRFTINSKQPVWQVLLK